MKKPIDPNLNNIDEEEIFQDLDIRDVDGTHGISAGDKSSGGTSHEKSD